MRTADATLGQVITAIGEPDFVERAANALCGFAGFDLSALIVHGDSGDAAVLFDNFDRMDGRRGIEAYVRATRCLNPMVGAGIGPRVVRARDFCGRHPRTPCHEEIVVAPDEELGYRTLGWPKRLEEIALHIPLQGAMLEIGLYRQRGRAAASPELLNSLALMGRPIAAAFARDEELGGRKGATPKPGCGLTQREAEVRDLLLRGCSTEAIALRLVISHHTVKSHRKAIFRKLGISALAELFALSRSSPPSGGYGARIS